MMFDAFTYRDLLQQERDLVEVNHCHGPGRGHPCSGIGAGKEARRERKIARRAARRAAAFGKTAMIEVAVIAAVAAVVKVEAILHKVGGHEVDERIVSAIHLGEKAVETIGHMWPALVHSAHDGTTAMMTMLPHLSGLFEASSPHPALPSLRKLQAAYAKLPAPTGRPEGTRLEALKVRIDTMITAAEEQGA